MNQKPFPREPHSCPGDLPHRILASARGRLSDCGVQRATPLALSVAVAAVLRRLWGQLGPRRGGFCLPRASQIGAVRNNTCIQNRKFCRGRCQADKKCLKTGAYQYHNQHILQRYLNFYYSEHEFEWNLHKPFVILLWPLGSPLNCFMQFL